LFDVFSYHHPELKKLKQNADKERERSLSQTKRRSSSRSPTPRSPGSPVENPHSDSAKFDDKLYEMPDRDGLYSLQRSWQSYWTYGSKTTKKVLKISCGCFGFLFILGIAASIILMGYKNNCGNFAKSFLKDSFNMTTSAQVLKLTNQYQRYVEIF
jgi:hypothetical protein